MVPSCLGFRDFLNLVTWPSQQLTSWQTIHCHGFGFISWQYLCTGVELFLGSKVLCEICTPSLFSLSPLWTANFKSKHAMNLWPPINNSTPVQYTYCSQISQKVPYFDVTLFAQKILVSNLPLQREAWPCELFRTFCWATLKLAGNECVHALPRPCSTCHEAN